MRMTQADVNAYEARRAVKNRPNPQATFEGVEKEAELHQQIYDECQRRGWIALHGAMSKPTHRTLGEPDFVILAGSGRVLFVECKARFGKLSLDQVAMMAHALKLGHTIHVVRTLAEFIAII